MKNATERKRQNLVEMKYVFGFFCASGKYLRRFLTQKEREEKSQTETRVLFFPFYFQAVAFSFPWWAVCNPGLLSCIFDELIDVCVRVRSIASGTRARARVYALLHCESDIR